MLLSECPDPEDWIFYYINIQVRTFVEVHLLTVATNSEKLHGYLLKKQILYLLTNKTLLRNFTMDYVIKSLHMY